MQVKMLKDKTGSNDGVRVTSFNKDEVYTVSESLCRSFVNEGVAVVVEAQDEPVVAQVEVAAAVEVEEKEEKALDEPENKVIDGAPENKAVKSKKAK